ncbi:MAG: SsgA family sporulation/cell division regulator [Actinomycetes bacterium]
MTTGPVPTIVSTEMDLELVLTGERSVTVSALLDYDVSEPYSVRATFRTSEGNVLWVFARELLAEGLHKPAGNGDVAIWPSRTHGDDVLCISLSSPSGQALMEAKRSDIQGFLQRTYAVAPEGTEGTFLDIDGLIDELLKEEGTTF